MVDDDRFPLAPGEMVLMRSIRFRTLGCYPLTGAVESEAASLKEVIQETLLTTSSERQGRTIDKDRDSLVFSRVDDNITLTFVTDERLTDNTSEDFFPVVNFIIGGDNQTAIVTGDNNTFKASYKIDPIYNNIISEIIDYEISFFDISGNSKFYANQSEIPIIVSKN